MNRASYSYAGGIPAGKINCSVVVTYDDGEIEHSTPFLLTYYYCIYDSHHGLLATVYLLYVFFSSSFLSRSLRDVL